MKAKNCLQSIPAILFMNAMLLLTMTQANAQFFEHPQASPLAGVMQRIGITDVKVHYSRPSVNEREVFGGIVPYGQIWRVGANENTTISFSTDVQINGRNLPAGTYGFHAIPGEQSWTLIFSRDHKSWGSYSYNQENDALRLEVEPESQDESVELLTFSFTEVGVDTATLAFAWDRLRVPMTISVDTKEQMMAQLEEEMMGDAQFYREAYVNAAQYLHDNDYELEQALAWVDYSIDGFFGARESYSNLMLKANILDKLDRGNEAEEVRQAALQHPTASAVDLFAYGRQLIASDQVEKAIEIFTLNYKKHPNDWIAQHGMARGYSALGEFEKAVEYEEMALKGAPDGPSKDALERYLERLKKQEDIN